MSNEKVAENFWGRKQGNRIGVRGAKGMNIEVEKLVF